jgi:YHS domain-containing protein
MTVHTPTISLGNVFFCGNGCKKRFETGAIDPMCGMSVDIVRAVDNDLFASAVGGDKGRQFFCNPKCKKRYVAGVVDPVCGMQVAVSKARAENLFAAPRGDHVGKQFFCSQQCKTKYEHADTVVDIPPPTQAKVQYTYVYECPMQCVEDFQQDKPGSCPKWYVDCFSDLKFNNNAAQWHGFGTCSSCTKSCRSMDMSDACRGCTI